MSGRSPTPPDGKLASMFSRMFQVGAESKVAGSLRSVVAAVQAHVVAGRRGLVVCGAASGAGASFVTASLALTIASPDLRTLVIDGNLRQPAIQDLIPPRSPGLGLLPYLRGEVDDPAAIVETDVASHLSAIYAGGTAEDAHDLFDTERFEQLMRYALRTYDLTLIDTPPANCSAETRRLAAVAGYAVVVARRNVTMADDMATLIKDLQLDKVEVIGSIFNEG